MITNGAYFVETLRALNLDEEQSGETTTNATEIASAVIAACGGSRDRAIDARRFPNRPATGLVYGRIQSGKTRAMIASTAMAFDNGFRISVVMTSNINDLVSQTHIDFSRGLPGIMIFTKDNDLDREVPNARVHLERGDGRLLLVCSKGTTSLENISKFLRDVGAEAYPSIIFDDEGDQASLDTNTARRTRTNIAVAPSAINDMIQNRLRAALRLHVYVSVTGTPQAVLLQSADSRNRPSFVRMLPAGAAYVGGDRFFSTEEPEDNANLISLVDANEKQQLLDQARPIPRGLTESILFFLVSSAAAFINLGPRERGYSYLCHPSLRNAEQDVAEQRINGYLTDVYGALLAGQAGAIMRDLRSAHARLTTTLGRDTPAFEQIVAMLRRQLPSRRILVINAVVNRQGIAYGQSLNFLIGGNTLGRGIAIRDLLVTYYVRDARVSQIDTMHQHARMYGYRSDTLAYTRLFVPRHLYYRFRDIHFSDRDLRAFIERHRDQLPTTYPIEVSFGLRATRGGVLDVGKVDTLQPGMHVYPNHIALPQTPATYRRVLSLLRRHFQAPNATLRELEARARRGATISVEQAVELATSIRTRSRNTWRDTTIGDAIRKVCERERERTGDGRVDLRFRTAERTVREGGFISTGTLSGPELAAARASARPTLWIMAVETLPESEVGQGVEFMYPTFVIPDDFDALFIFNRGS